MVILVPYIYDIFLSKFYEHKEEKRKNQMEEKSKKICEEAIDCNWEKVNFPKMKHLDIKENQNYL